MDEQYKTYGQSGDGADRPHGFRKRDAVFLVILAAVGAMLLAVYIFAPKSPGIWVEISVDGDISGRYRLDQAQTIEISGTGADPEGSVTNRLVIADGKADMTEADCPDHICVEHRPISNAGETIICLPNKVAVTVVGEEEKELDAVAR